MERVRRSLSLATPAAVATLAAMALSAIGPVGSLQAQAVGGPAAAIPAPAGLPTAAGAGLAAPTAGLPGGPGATPGGRGGTALRSLGEAGQSLCNRLKNSPLGQLVAGLRKPLSTITGGLVPSEKTPSAEDQKQDGPGGTAAQVKASQLEAPKRQAAIRQLQGVDVRYHPEAETALIGALRTDPSECVRYEAALAITSLPVCTQALADALQVCVEGSHRDGNPAELSPRVRIQAEIALSHCQQCLPPGTAAEGERPEYPEDLPAPAPPADAITTSGPFTTSIPFTTSGPFTAPGGVAPVGQVTPTAPVQVGGPTDAIVPAAAAPRPSPTETLAPPPRRPRNLAEVLRAARG